MKRIASLFLISFACFIISCNKEENAGEGNGTAVLGISVKGLPTLVEVPENQTLAFELTVTAEPGPSDALNVTVGTDESLVQEYNLTNGTSHMMLPATAYELPSGALMLMRYNKTSAPGTLKLKGVGCEIGKTYLLPLIVDQVKGTAAYEAPEENTVYVVFTMLEAQVDGAGTEGSPYLVGDITTFGKIGNMLKDNETVYLKLTADIDFEGETWAPADAEGIYAQIDATKRPISLDGDNHVIKNVVAECALFSNLEGSVQNLVFDNIVIEAGSSNSGVLADVAGNGTDEVIINNVTVSNSSVINSGHAGALVGRITKGTVTNVNIECDVEAADRVGGMFGHTISCTITDCVASGNVTASSYYSGGFIGMMYNSTLKNCSASGNVTHTAGGYSRVGGLVGQMIAGGTVEKCHASGSVSGVGYFGGALIGVVEALETLDGVETVHTATIRQSYATGSVQLIRDLKDAGAGGLVGRMESGNLDVIDCYAAGSVEADRWSSGFIGDVNKGKLTITNGFSNCDLSKLGPDANGNHSDGIVIGEVRTPAETTIKCKGFVAWNLYDRAFAYQSNGEALSSSGNYYGTSGTISQQSTELGWDAGVWDLSGEVPVLK